MNHDRLERLAALLDNVPEEKFDLDAWACGTTACAVGWAALDPTFRSEGLRLDVVYALPFSRRRNRRREITDLPQAEASWTRRKPVVVPVFRGASQYDAVEWFFGLTAKVARDLFSSRSYSSNATASDVAKRIRALLAKSKAADKAKPAPQHEPEVARALAAA